MIYIVLEPPSRVVILEYILVSVVIRFVDLLLLFAVRHH